MAGKRQPTRPSTRAPIGDQELDQVEREAGAQVERAKRRKMLTAHLEAIGVLYKTYREVHSADEDALRQRSREDAGGAEFDRWLNGDRRDVPPPIPSSPPIPRLLVELGAERRRTAVERNRIEAMGCPAKEEDGAEAMLRILVERGWSSPQVAAAVKGIEGRKTFDVKAEPEARQASRVRVRLCEQLRKKLACIQAIRKSRERVGEMDAVAARAELDALKAARNREVGTRSLLRLEVERMGDLAVIVDLDSFIESMQAKLVELELRGASSPGRKRGRPKAGRPRRE